MKKFLYLKGGEKEEETKKKEGSYETAKATEGNVAGIVAAEGCMKGSTDGTELLIKKLTK